MISAFTYYTYALLSIIIWIVCIRIPFRRLPFLVWIGMHFTLSVIISGLWVLIVYGSWYLQDKADMMANKEAMGAIGWQFLLGIMTYFIVAAVNYTLIYYRQYREKELNEINAFYITPTGQKVINDVPRLVQQRNQLAMKRMQENIGQLQKEIAAEESRQP